MPPSFHYPDAVRSIEALELPSLDLNRIAEEDVAMEESTGWTNKGRVIPIDFDFTEEGVWTDLPNGDRVCRLVVRSPGALSINFLYSDFYMPGDALLYLWRAS